MRKQSVLFILLSLLLASCGGFNAASNSDRGDDDDDGGGRNGNGNGNNTQAISVEELPDVLNSQIFRAKSTKIYKYSEESNFFRTDSVPSTLFPIPDKVAQDQDKQTTSVNDAVDCGISFDSGVVTIARRISDCRTKNEDNTLAYYWKGADNGIAGEGDWRLVAHKSGRSVWLDVATGLVWSPRIAANTWNMASGNVEDSAQICNGANDTETKNYFLGIQADEVAWRLPTRNDFLQADINGSRYVLPVGEGAVNYWTANFISDEGAAWVIELSSGVLSKRDQNNPTAIRCVGSVIK